MPDTTLLMIAANKGDIIIDKSVTLIQGLYYTSKGSIITNPSDKQLKLTGIFIADTLKLNRNLAEDNATIPSEVFFYKPSLLLTAPAFLQVRYTLWENVGG